MENWRKGFCSNGLELLFFILMERNYLKDQRERGGESKEEVINSLLSLT